MGQGGGANLGGLRWVGVPPRTVVPRRQRFPSEPRSGAPELRGAGGTRRSRQAVALPPAMCSRLPGLGGIARSVGWGWVGRRGDGKKKKGRELLKTKRRRLSVCARTPMWALPCPSSPRPSIPSPLPLLFLTYLDGKKQAQKGRPFCYLLRNDRALLGPPTFFLLCFVLLF